MTELQKKAVEKYKVGRGNIPFDDENVPPYQYDDDLLITAWSCGMADRVIGRDEFLTDEAILQHVEEHNTIFIEADKNRNGNKTK